jgi:hypothetical protein
MSQIELAKLIPIERMVGEDEQETAEFQELYARAQKYIGSFKWCIDIRNAYFGLGVAYIVGVFYFEITPASSAVDSALWVIVGDIPPAYLVTDDAPNAACALDGYIVEMRRWVAAVTAGKPVTDVIPVNAPPTMENAKMLESRLGYLASEILSDYDEDLARRE